MAESPLSGNSDRPEPIEIQRSSRDPQALATRLEQWLGSTLELGAEPKVSGLEGTSSNGMSSETIIFDGAWNERNDRSVHHLVARVAPDAADVPVFPSYDLRRQFELLRLVGSRTSVPVPDAYWFESSATALGAPFFVMSRVDGLVPPDVMPYNFGDSWIFDADPSEQRTLQDSTVAVLAELHRLGGDDPDVAFLQFEDPGDTPLRRHVAHTSAWYEFAVADGERSPLVDRGFEWLDANWPDHEGKPVVSWGDSRIGNVMYRDFRPVAVLDWEMAGIGPRELDVGWLVFAHQVFETLAAQYDLPGMPDFLRADDVSDTYAEHAGVELDSLDWYLTYAAVQWGIVFLRTGKRAIHFGEQEPPADVDDLMHHRSLLAELVGD